MHPLKLYIMGALLNAIGSNAESLANGALSSLIGGSISSHFSKSLMRYQDKLNDQNALDAYNRQRELMGDSASLQKQGMLNAGYNTAFGSNGSVQSVSSQPGSSVGLGSVSSDNMPKSFQTLLDASNSSSSGEVAAAQSGLLRSQQQSQDIKNAFEIDRQISELEQLHKANKISDVEYQTRMENLQRLKDTHDSYVTEQSEKAKQAEIQTKIADIQKQQEGIKTDILNITKQLNDEQLKQAKFVTEHQFERYVKDMQEQDSRIAANKASAAASYASAAASRAQAMYTATLNKLEAAKVPYADKIASAAATTAYNGAITSYWQRSSAKTDSDRNKFELERDKDFHSGNSYSFYSGEVMRNFFAGWLPFSGSVNYSTSKKAP